MRVKIADDASMSCDQGIPNCLWICDGHEFYTDFKFLPLGSYDGILGLD